MSSGSLCVSAVSDISSSIASYPYKSSPHPNQFGTGEIPRWWAHPWQTVRFQLSAVVSRFCWNNLWSWTQSTHPWWWLSKCSSVLLFLFGLLPPLHCCHRHSHHHARLHPILTRSLPKYWLTELTHHRLVQLVLVSQDPHPPHRHQLQTINLECPIYPNTHLFSTYSLFFQHTPHEISLHSIRFLCINRTSACRTTELSSCTVPGVFLELLSHQTYSPVWGALSILNANLFTTSAACPYSTAWTMRRIALVEHLIAERVSRLFMSFDRNPFAPFSFNALSFATWYSLSYPMTLPSITIHLNRVLPSAFCAFSPSWRQSLSSTSTSQLLQVNIDFVQTESPVRSMW